MKIVIAGNWKMHHGPSEARGFFARFRPEFDPERVELLLFVPAISLAASRDTSRQAEDGGRISLGVQDIHWEAKGAFTGQLSAEMAADAGATHALVGHSERRHLFGETDGETALKFRAALRAGLLPVLCVGETLEERSAGRLESVVTQQLDAVFENPGDLGLGAEGGRGADIMIAYEPVWAIGTGQTATPDDASAAHELIRGHLAGRLGPRASDATPILYGGSVKPENATALLDSPHIDGVLVGGASLDPESFARIAQAAN